MSPKRAPRCATVVPVLVAAVVAVVASGCSYRFDRLNGIAPGDISGSAVEEDTGKPASFARVEPAGGSKVFRALDSGAFVVRGLSTGSYVLRFSEDTDGDGFLNRGAYRAVSLTTFAGATGKPGCTSVLLGDVKLEGTATVKGRVLKGAAGTTPLVGARVVAYRRADDLSGDATKLLDEKSLRTGTQELPAESEVASGADGSFTLPGVVPGDARILVLLRIDDPQGGAPQLFIFDSGKKTLGAGATVDLGDVRALATGDAAHDVQVSIIVGASSGSAAVHMKIERAADPFGPPAAEIDVPPGADVTLQLPVDIYDVLIVDGNTLRGGLQGVPSTTNDGDVARWVVILDAADACDGDSRDRDGDGLPSIPIARMAECKAQCAGKDGAANASAACTLDGKQFDCNDDGDDQNDPSEVACFGACSTSDGDGDGACSGVDLDPCCNAQTGACLPACGGAVSVDGGVVVDGGTAQDAGTADAGTPDAGFPPFFDAIADPGQEDSLTGLDTNLGNNAAAPPGTAPLVVISGVVDPDDDAPDAPATVGGCAFAFDGARNASQNGYIAWLDATTGSCVDVVLIEEIGAAPSTGSAVAGVVLDDNGDTIAWAAASDTARVLHSGVSLLDIPGNSASQAFAMLLRISADRTAVTQSFVTSTSAGAGTVTPRTIARSGGFVVVTGEHTAGEVDLGAQKLGPLSNGCCRDAFVALFDTTTLTASWAVAADPNFDNVVVTPREARIDPSSGDVVWLANVAEGSISDGVVTVSGDAANGAGTLLQRLHAADGTSAWQNGVGGQDNIDFLGFAQTLAISSSGARLVVGGHFVSSIALTARVDPNGAATVFLGSTARAGFVADYDAATGDPVVAAPSPDVVFETAGFGNQRASSIESAVFGPVGSSDTALFVGGETNAEVAVGGQIIRGARDLDAQAPFLARLDGTALTWSAAGRPFGGPTTQFGAAIDDVTRLVVLPPGDIVAIGSAGGRTVFGDSAAQPRQGNSGASEDGWVWRVDDGGATIAGACAASADCGSGSACDPVTRACVVACASTADCPGTGVGLGRDCDPFTKLCGDVCNSDFGCSDATTACSRGLCLPTCETAPPDLVCSSSTECCDFTTGACTAAPTTLADEWRWDSTSGGFWSQLFISPTPPARTGAALAGNFPGQLALFGGRGSDGVLLSDTWVWDANVQSWTQQLPSSPPKPRVGQAMAEVPFIGNNSIGTLLFGGEDDAGVITGESGFVLSPPEWAPVTGANVPPARADAAMAFDGVGTVFLFGGRDPSGALLADLWPFDVATQQWGAEIIAQGALVPRSGHMMARNPLTNEVIVAGGVDASGTLLDDVWDLDTQTTPPTWGQLSNLPEARAFAGMAPDSNENIVLVGGVGPTDVDDETFVDGGAGFAFFEGRRVPRRERAAVAFDGQAVILVGGNDVISDSVCAAVDAQLL